MSATERLAQHARMFGVRLLVVVMLAVAVSGATYAVAVSPVGVSMASNARRPPGKPADATSQTAVPAATAAAPATTSDESVTGQAQATQAQPQRPPGGGRGPSLTQGLPEMGMHALVVGVIVLTLNGARSLWQMIQRRRGGNRAPIYRHAAAGQ